MGKVCSCHHGKSLFAQVCSLQICSLGEEGVWGLGMQTVTFGMDGHWGPTVQHRELGVIGSFCCTIEIEETW